ncbi:4955_t:CDS:2 [Ambispora leptoticha]|uniref:4955_t:CDS:1 n=1 Tax=Ambispora leptoticha TaxID=144679 RepID=A0A9N9F4V5_9GLOM|nr:4955_t:CDS:2 [Ambispora leptoticha]
MKNLVIFEKFPKKPNRNKKKPRSKLHFSRLSFDETSDDTHDVENINSTASATTTKFTLIEINTDRKSQDFSRDPNECPGIHCFQGNLKDLRSLLSKGRTDPNGLYPVDHQSNSYPLSILAIQQQPISKVISLLSLIEEYNGNIMIRDPQLKRTVLLESASKLMTRELEYVENYPILIEWLVRTKKFNIHEVDIEEGCGILHFVVLTKFDQCIPPILAKCIELGANPRAEDSKRLNALAYVAKFKSLRTLMEVMEKVPAMRDEETLQRAIKKTPKLSKRRAYLKRWLNERYYSVHFTI